MNLVYAKAFGSDGKDLRTLLGILESFVTDMHPRAYLVDTFPVIDYLPDVLAPWRNKARKMHEVEVEVAHWWSFPGIVDIRNCSSTRACLPRSRGEWTRANISNASQRVSGRTTRRISWT